MRACVCVCSGGGWIDERGGNRAHYYFRIHLWEKSSLYEPHFLPLQHFKPNCLTIARNIPNFRTAANQVYYNQLLLRHNLLREKIMWRFRDSTDSGVKGERPSLGTGATLTSSDTEYWVNQPRQQVCGKLQSIQICSLVENSYFISKKLTDLFCPPPPPPELFMTTSYKLYVVI